jgi:hypothetical protein
MYTVRSSSSFKRLSVLVVFFLLAPLFLAACASAPTTTSSCAYVVGVGKGDYDARVHKVVIPGEKVAYDTYGEKVVWVPCNARNYIVNDGSVRNADGTTVGDRPNLIEATTSTGVPILIAAHALWTLNQSDTSMRNFYDLCFKYTCASPTDVGGDNNFAPSKGWNGLLAENFGTALDTAARRAAFRLDDSVWLTQNPAQYDILANEMAKEFPGAVRANVGYTEDLFCGSNNSVWSDPSSPGTGEFLCSPVRIQVDRVVRKVGQDDQSSAGVLAINQQRLKNAEALYGPADAGYWLGVMDAIDKCKGTGLNCVVNLGGVSGAVVAIPADEPTPTPTPVPTPKK